MIDVMAACSIAAAYRIARVLQNGSPLTISINGIMALAFLINRLP
jgi:hypothetical protein